MRSIVYVYIRDTVVKRRGQEVPCGNLCTSNARVVSAVGRCGRAIPNCHHDDKRWLPPEIISRWMPLLFRSFVCVVMATGDSRVRGHAVDPRELRDASVNVVYTEEDAAWTMRDVGTGTEARSDYTFLRLHNCILLASRLTKLSLCLVIRT